MKRGPRTLQDLIAGLLRVPDRRAVGLRSDLGLRWWKHDRLFHEMRRAAVHLEALGVEPGSRVVLWGANSPEWAAYFLAAAWRGAVAVPVDHKLPLDFVRCVAAEVQAPAILHDGGEAGSVDGRPFVPLFALIRQPDPGDRAALPALTAQPGDPAAILYSSGTTAAPHGVALTHGSLASQVEPFGRWRVGIDLHPLRMLSTTPMSHVQGLVAGLLLPLHLGLCLAFVRSTEPAHLLRVLRDNRIAILLTVPRLLRALGDALLGSRSAEGGPTLAARLEGRPAWLRRGTLLRHKRRIAGRQLGLVLVGGARLPAETERFWRRAGVLVTQTYGLTETTGAVTYSNPFSLRPGTIGRPRPGYEVRIGADGEILVRGAGVSPDGGERTADGFFHTGDLGRWDERGRLVFLGRKKELIVTSEGLNVDPEWVEGVLERQPGVLASAVVPFSEEVHAVLVLAPGADASAAVSGANRELPEPARIRSWTVWPGEDLPRGPAGKVRRAEVAAGLRHRPAAEPEILDLDRILAEPDPSLRLRLLARHVAHPALPESDGADLELVDHFGLGSLDVAEFLGHLEGLCGAPVEGLAVDRSTTLADLHRQARLLASGAAAPPVPRQAPVRQSPVATILPVRLVRPLVRRLTVEVWAALGTLPEARWSFDPASLRPPVILAAGPHVHWQEAFAIYRVLPRRLRGRLFVVTDPYDSLRWLLHYHVTLPLLFPAALLRPFGRSREGLLEAGRLVDLRHSMISFPSAPSRYRGYRERQAVDPGPARFALEAGVPLVPVLLEGNEELGWRPRRPRRRVVLHFGEPILPAPTMSTQEVMAELERAFERLRRAGAV